MDVDTVNNFFKSNGTLKGYPRATDNSMINPESYIEKPCDILIPAAVERTIHSLNASKI